MTDTMGSTPAEPQPDSPRRSAPQQDRQPTALASERYGAPRAGMGRGRKIGLAVAGLGVLGGVVGYIGWQQANPAITATVLRYSAGTNSVSVTFEVDKPADRAVSCTLVAQDAHNSVVGSVDVQVPSGRGKNVMSYVLSTTTSPNTVQVQACSMTS